MITRKLTKDDTPQFKKLYLDYLTSVHKYYSSWDKKSFPNFVDQAVTFIKKRNFRILGVFEKDKLIAFVNASLHYSKNEEYYFVWLNDIFVYPKFRGKGIARKLVKEIEKWAVKKGATEIKSGSSIRNEASLRMWTKLGYEKWDVEFRKELSKE